MKIENPPGATPLDDEALRGLIPSLTTQGELNEFEERNIADAIGWALKSRKLRAELLSAAGLMLLHEKMFDQTWKWAGDFRSKDLNIGVDWHRIQSELGQLLGDVKYWLENKTFPIEEIAIRFSYKLVWIHPFLNGNGRFSRLAADLLMIYNGHQKFSWGSQNLTSTSDARDTYLRALRKVDRNNEDIGDLIKFSKS